MVDAHKITEQTILIAHRIYANLIDQDHGYLDRARCLLESKHNSGSLTAGEEAWLGLFDAPWTSIRTAMLADTPNGRLLRSNSPFSLVIGISDPQERRQLWRQAKHDLSVATISHAR